MLKNKLNSCQLTSKLGCSASDYTDCPQLESSGPIQPGKYKYPNILLVRARVSEPNVHVSTLKKTSTDSIRWKDCTVYTALYTCTCTMYSEWTLSRQDYWEIILPSLIICVSICNYFLCSITSLSLGIFYVQFVIEPLVSHFI